eukprot:2336154-Lingulodinium_polyedra.AAC.1
MCNAETAQRAFECTAAQLSQRPAQQSAERAPRRFRAAQYTREVTPRGRAMLERARCMFAHLMRIA